MKNILNETFTFKELFLGKKQMNEGGHLKHLIYLGSRGKNMNEVAFFYDTETKKYYRNPFPGIDPSVVVEKNMQELTIDYIPQNLRVKPKMKEGGRFEDSPNVEKLIKELGWKEKDVIDTWSDDENEERAAIARIIMDTFPHEQEKVIKTIKHPEFRKYMSANIYDFSGIKVIVQPGMPDSIFYNKKNHKALLNEVAE